MQYGSIKVWDDWSPQVPAPFMNMGIMLMNKSFAKYLEGQTPREFLERREFKMFIDGMGAWKWSTDQTLLNYWIPKTGMKVKIYIGLGMGSLLLILKSTNVTLCISF